MDMQQDLMQIRRALQRRLEALAEEEYRSFQSKLIPGKDSILGVRIPTLRKLAQEVAKKGLVLPAEQDSPVAVSTAAWPQCVKAVGISVREDPGGCYFEETLLGGLIIGYAKIPLEELFVWVDAFVPHIDNWATCDVFCGTLKAVTKHREETWRFLEPYWSPSRRDPSDPADEYPIRFGAVMLLSHFIVEEYIDWVLEALESMNHEGYYAKMAVAWALSICFVKFPEKTMALYRDNRLDDFTYNKALQKTTESFRVDAQTKALLRSMKRK